MLESAGWNVLDFHLESTIRPRHMDALVRKGPLPANVKVEADIEEVLSRLHTLDAATRTARAAAVTHEPNQDDNAAGQSDV